MRLVLISDTHGQHGLMNPLPEGDVLIHAGDFMRSGRQAQEIKDFAYWLQEQPHAHKLVIAGNHDLLMEARPEFGALLGDVGACYLQDSEVVIPNPGNLKGRVHFYGSPWTPSFMNWAFMSDRGEGMRTHWDLIPDDTDVLITHGPPAGILDSSPTFGDSLGCADLREAVLRFDPTLLVFGHIHAGYGQRQFGSTLYVNAAVLNEQYELANLPVVVDI